MSSVAEMPKDDYSDRKGYQKDFISKKRVVPLPDFSRVSDVFAPNLKKQSPYEIPYHHFSVILHKKRKLPLLTASNIDGTAFKSHLRKDSWRKDPRAGDFQWGDELYTAAKSDFDKGHMTRREDPAWGTPAEAFSADQDTFHFTNSVPQVHELNGVVWKELEDHVLRSGAVATGARISVFTGPVLDGNDPTFVTNVGGSAIRIPNRFWKVIVWEKQGKGLHAVGFVMSQKEWLLDKGIVARSREVSADDVFEHITFKDGKTYQVPLSTIEKMTGIAFNWKRTTFPNTEARAVEAVASRGLAGEVESIPNRESSGLQIQNVVL